MSTTVSVKHLLPIVFVMVWYAPGLAKANPTFRCINAEVEQQVTPDNVGKLISACTDKRKRSDGKPEAIDVMGRLATAHFLRIGQNYQRPDQVKNYLKLVKEWGIPVTDEHKCRLAEFLDPGKNQYIEEKERSSYQRSYEEQIKALTCGATNVEVVTSGPQDRNATSNNEALLIKTNELLRERLEALTQRISHLEQIYNADKQSLPHPRKLDAEIQSPFYLGPLLFLLVFLNVIVCWMVIAPPHFIRQLVSERRSNTEQRSEPDKGIPQLPQESSPIKVHVELNKMDVQLRQPRIEEAMGALLRESRQMKLSILQLVARNEEKTQPGLNELKGAGTNTQSIQTVRRAQESKERTALVLLNELLAAIGISQAEDRAKAHGYPLSFGKLDQSDTGYILRSDTAFAANTHLFAIVHGDQRKDGYLVPLAVKGQLLTAPASWFYDLQDTRSSYVNQIITPARVEFLDETRQWFSLISKGQMK